MASWDVGVLTEAPDLGRDGEIPRDPLAQSPITPAPAGTPRPLPWQLIAEEATRGKEINQQARELSEQQLAEARTREQAALQRKADAAGPMVADLQQRQAALGQEAQLRQPAEPVLPTQPATGVRAFLAPVDGEAPEQSIAKLLTAIGVIATGVTGLARGDARSALAALTGAMQGWQAGDKERADRDFKAWQAATEQARTRWTMARSQFQDWMSNAKIDLDQRLTGLNLAMMQYGLDVDVARNEREGIDGAIKRLEKRDADFNTMLESAAKLQQAWQLAKDKEAFEGEQREMTRSMQERIAVMTEEGRNERAAADAALRRDLSADRLAEREAAKAAGSKVPGAIGDQIVTNDLARDYVATLTEMVPRVRLDKIVGNIKPWITRVMETGTFFSLPVSIDEKALSTDERTFLSMTRDYSDRVLRGRSGKAVTENEFARMIMFLVSEQAEPKSFLARLASQQRTLEAEGNILRRVYGDYNVTPYSRTLQAPPVETPATPTGPVGRGASPRILSITPVP